jgi:C4-dicarboxylate-specific signal transduction histidine kinase
MALRQTSERIVELRVVPKTIDDKAVIEFSVQDTGKGLAPEVMAGCTRLFTPPRPTAWASDCLCVARLSNRTWDG